jgi:hypothetical protein
MARARYPEDPVRQQLEAMAAYEVCRVRPRRRALRALPRGHGGGGGNTARGRH